MRISDWSSDVCSSDLGKLVTKDDLDLAGGTADGADEEAWLNLRSAREAADRVAIRRAMTQSEGNISAAAKLLGKIGRASCRERVCQNVWISVVAVSYKQKN